jgi:protein involved in polysaccharide export with SLBB domain
VPALGRVFVAGNVRHPGMFRIENATGMSVLKAVAMAEGLAPFSAKQAFILRDGAEIPVELREITDRKSGDVPLAANDILYIPDSRRARASANAIEKIIAFAAGTASGALILGVNR